MPRPYSLPSPNPSATESATESARHGAWLKTLLTSAQLREALPQSQKLLLLFWRENLHQLRPGPGLQREAIDIRGG